MLRDLLVRSKSRWNILFCPLRYTIRKLNPSKHQFFLLQVIYWWLWNPLHWVNKAQSSTWLLVLVSINEYKWCKFLDTAKSVIGINPGWELYWIYYGHSEGSRWYPLSTVSLTVPHCPSLPQTLGTQQLSYQPAPAKIGKNTQVAAHLSFRYFGEILVLVKCISNDLLEAKVE